MTPALAIRLIGLVTAAFLCIVFPVARDSEIAATGQAPSAPPPLVLWAWERKEDLRFIDPDRVGVAFLAKTIRVADQRVDILPRRQPLHVRPGVWLLAVARLETDRRAKSLPSMEQTDRVVAALEDLRRLPAVRGIQIDFDATESERGFYREVIEGLRRRLGPSYFLSITALASWCVGDGWIGNLPVSEAVPMLFRMGPDERSIGTDVRRGRPFRVTLCRGPVGVSLDERGEWPPRPVRAYAFNPLPWSPESVAALRPLVDGVE